MKFEIGEFFENLSGKFKVSLKSNGITDTLPEDLCTVIIVSH